MPTPTPTPTLVVSALLLVEIGQVVLLSEPLDLGPETPLARVVVAFAPVALAVEALEELAEAEVWLRTKPAAKAEPL